MGDIIPTLNLNKQTPPLNALFVHNQRFKPDVRGPQTALERASRFLTLRSSGKTAEGMFTLAEESWEDKVVNYLL